MSGYLINEKNCLKMQFFIFSQNVEAIYIFYFFNPRQGNQDLDNVVTT
jgi:hypothetical protein